METGFLKKVLVSQKYCESSLSCGVLPVLTLASERTRIPLSKNVLISTSFLKAIFTPLLLGHEGYMKGQDSALMEPPQPQVACLATVCRVLSMDHTAGLPDGQGALSQVPTTLRGL